MQFKTGKLSQYLETILNELMRGSLSWMLDTCAKLTTEAINKPSLRKELVFLFLRLSMVHQSGRSITKEELTRKFNPLQIAANLLEKSSLQSVELQKLFRTLDNLFIKEFFKGEDLDSNPIPKVCLEMSLVK